MHNHILPQASATSPHARRRSSARGGFALTWACALVATSALTAGCSDGATVNPQTAPPPPGCDVAVKPGADDQTAIQTVLIEAKDGSTVCLLAGSYSFTSELSITSNNITLKGDGQDKTILDFKGQTVGANGLLITGDGTTVQELTVKNTPGDGIRATDVKDIHWKNVSVLWDAAGSTQNGAYGLYPVGSDGVRIEGCIVSGASDAGIYVGQSTNILVADSEAFGNVAGIEIENSTDAEVRNNKAHDNTGGILVFNLPDLPVQDGKRANVHDNIIENNNLANFAAKGTTVASVPAGTGLMILASDDNEVHNNTITGNNSLGILLFSYSDQVFPNPNDPTFNKYPQGNWIHDNTLSGNGTSSDGLVKVLIVEYPVPDVVFDGCVEAGVDNSMNMYTNCISGNGAATYLDMACLEGTSSTDISKVTCEHSALPAQDP